MILINGRFYMPKCDKCGTVLNDGYGMGDSWSMGDALANMKAAGWERKWYKFRGEYACDDYCEKCKGKP